MQNVKVFGFRMDNFTGVSNSCVQRRMKAGN